MVESVYLPPAALRGASRQARGRLPLDPHLARLWVTPEACDLHSHCMIPILDDEFRI